MLARSAPMTSKMVRSPTSWLMIDCEMSRMVFCSSWTLNSQA